MKNNLNINWQHEKKDSFNIAITYSFSICLVNFFKNLIDDVGLWSLAVYVHAVEHNCLVIDHADHGCVR